MAEAAKKTVVDVIRQWPASRKMSLAGVALLSLIFFGVIIAQSRTADYRLLYANLSTSDASTILERLKEQKIPYRLEDGATAILIPADKVYEMRLLLAGSGLPQGGGVGFEIFDRQSFGTTEFAQKVNYRRALQGELARTIVSLAPVETARVHLVIPERRLFREQQQPATASVILKLIPGRELNESQIQGIINLVSGSVEGLETSRVSVIDATGRVLTRPPRDEDSILSPGMLEYQQAVERRMEARAQALLDRALGAGNSLVQVTAKVDFSQRERLEERFDPDGTAVRSEQVSQEKSGAEVSGGVPGVQANLQEGGTFFGGIPSSRSEETTNYEVSKVVSKLVEPVGSVQNLSVAVLVSDRVVPGQGGEAPTYVPREAAELQAIETMVRSALGLEASRGDQIAIVARPFEGAFFTDLGGESVAGSRFYEYLPFIKYALIVVGAALVYFLLVRPMVRTLREEGKKVEHFKTVEELQAELAAGQQPLLLGTGSLDESVKRLRQEIMQSKNSPSQVVKAWLKEE